MANHNILGQDGEEAAARYLMFEGYSLLERNWRVGHLEVDIIAERRGLLVFAEVKTRSSDSTVLPEARVDREKRGRLLGAAAAYLSLTGEDRQIRFDILSVTGQAPSFTVRHIENAFSPDPRTGGDRSEDTIYDYNNYHDKI